MSACAAAPASAHCWHRAFAQHAIENHRDDVCCWCGEPRCVRLDRPAHRPGHGPYDPGRDPARGRAAGADW